LGSWGKINQSKSLRELVENIPAVLLHKASAVMLLLLIFTPIGVMILDTFFGGRLIWMITLDLFIAVGCLVGLILFAKSVIYIIDRKITIRCLISENAPQFFLTLMLICSTVSVLVNGTGRQTAYVGNFYADDSFLNHLAYFGIFCCGLAIRKIGTGRMLMRCFTSVAAFLAIFVAFDIPALNELLHLTRSSAIFYNTNHYGYYACTSLMCAVALFVDTGKRKRRKPSAKLVYAAEIALITYSIGQNGSFGPVVAPIAGFTMLVILLVLSRKEKIRTAVAAALIFSVMLAVSNSQTGRIAHDFSKLSSDIGNIAEGNESAAKAGSGRWEIWVAGVRYALEKPLLGYGQTQLRQRYAEQGFRNLDPHNEFIYYAASIGIPAVLFYLAGLAALLIRFIRQCKLVDTLSIGLFCATATYLISSFFGVLMFNTAPFFFMLLGLSVSVSDVRVPVNQEERWEEGFPVQSK